MEKDVQRYFESGLAPSTRKTYRSGILKFHQFCTLYSVSNPLPVSQSLLCSYVVYLAQLGLCYSTIKTYLSAVRYLQITNDMPEPRADPMPKLKMVETGVRKSQASQQLIKKPRLPITPTILRQIKTLWLPRAYEFDTIMLWAACCLCFFGFFRMGELTVPSDSSYDSSVHLSFGDVAADDPSAPSILSIHLKASKTDRFRKGVDVFVGRTEQELCPVSAVLAYMAVRGAKPGPLFQFKDGRPLTRDRLISNVRVALDSLGIVSEHYSGHSFRIGAATTAAECGLQDSMIKALGRWESSAYQVYVRTPKDHLASISKTLAKSKK